MDDVIRWVISSFFYGIVAGALLAAAFVYLRGPSDYEDCLWQASERQTTRGIALAEIVCERRFKSQ